jgi:hypothetical protein
MPGITLSRIAGGRQFLLALAAAASLAAPSVARAQGAQAKLTPQLDSVRAGLDKYQDPMVAVANGYLSTVACIEFPKPFSEGPMNVVAGGMGVHFINMSTVGPTLDPTKPQVLIYEPQGDKLVLVAAEWFMPVQAAGSTHPTVFGQELNGPMEGHPPIMPPELHHYDLHVWLWKQNSAGVFSPTNPAVKCGKGQYSFAGDPPKMVGGHSHN